jgi:hypothetical protein
LTVKFTRHALNQIEEAARWYEGRRPGLGNAFVEAARETAKRIEANPTAYQCHCASHIRNRAATHLVSEIG